MSQQLSDTGRNYLLLGLFVVLLADQIFGFGLGLMPGLSLKNLYLYVIIMYLVSSAVIQGRFMVAAFPPFYAVFIFLCVYGLVSWAVASAVRTNYNSLAHLMSLKNQLVDPLLFFSVFFFGCRSAVDAKWIATRTFWVFALMGLVLLIDFVNMPNLGIVPDREDGRLEGSVGGTNGFAALLVFFLLAMSPLALSRERSPWIIPGVLAVIALVLLTGSRGALAALVGGAALATFVLRRRLDLRSVVIVGGIALGVLVVLVSATLILYPDMFLDRLERTESETLWTATSGRSEMWRRGLLRMWEDPHSFVIGFGWDTFAYSLIYPDPHSQYLFMLYSTGLIGLGLYLYVLIAIVRTAVTAVDVANASDRAYLIAFVYSFASLMVAITFATLYTPWPFIWAYTGLMTKLAWLALHAGEKRDESPVHAGAPASKLGYQAALRSHR